MDEQENELGLQIAPLLDVLFVLLLFFMVCAASQKKESELRMQLPVQAVAGAAAASTQAIVRIDVQTDGRVYYNQKFLEGSAAKNLSKLQALLAENMLQSASTPVIIVPSPLVPYERVINVLDACRSANVKNIRFGSPPG